MLIEYGANVNQMNAAGQTPLILVAVGGHDELTKVLLEAGADPRTTNSHGQTALDIATAMEKIVICPHYLDDRVLKTLHVYMYILCVCFCLISRVWLHPGLGCILWWDFVSTLQLV